MPFNAYIWWAEPPRDIEAYKAPRAIICGQFYSHVLKLLLDSDYAYVPEGFQCEHAAFKAFEAIVFHLPLIWSMWLDEYLDEVTAVHLTGTAYDDWKSWTFERLAEWAGGKFTEARVQKYLDRYVWRGLSNSVEAAKRIFKAKMEEFGSSAPSPREALELDCPASSDDGSDDDGGGAGNDGGGAGNDVDGTGQKRPRSRSTTSGPESKRRPQGHVNRRTN